MGRTKRSKSFVKEESRGHTTISPRTSGEAQKDLAKGAGVAAKPPGSLGKATDH
jgi:hypothetical protein